MVAVNKFVLFMIFWCLANHRAVNNRLQAIRG